MSHLKNQRRTKTIKTNRTILINLEVTCWYGPIPAGQINEIIEIEIMYFRSLNICND